MSRHRILTQTVRVSRHRTLTQTVRVPAVRSPNPDTDTRPTVPRMAYLAAGMLCICAQRIDPQGAAGAAARSRRHTNGASGSAARAPQLGAVSRLAAGHSKLEPRSSELGFWFNGGCSIPTAGICLGKILLHSSLLERCNFHSVKEQRTVAYMLHQGWLGFKSITHRYQLWRPETK